MRPTTSTNREPQLQEVDINDQQAGDFSVSQTAKTEEVYVFPASLEQHRYWILDQVDSESTASNMAIAASQKMLICW